MSAESGVLLMPLSVCRPAPCPFSSSLSTTTTTSHPSCMNTMLRVPLSEVRSTTADHDLTNTGDSLLILLNPCTEIASESFLKTEGTDASTPLPLGEKRRTLDHDKNTKMVFYRVSSHSLALASSYFRSIFNDAEDDATHHAEFGKRLEISQEWDPAALLVILQIVHFQFNNIPAKISDVYFLGKLVVIADYVKCLDVLKPFTEKWLSSLGGPWKCKNPSLPLSGTLPTHFRVVTTVREATIWAYVSWKLSLGESFKEATISLLFSAKKPIENLALPLNPLILSMLLIIYSFFMAMIGP